MWLQLQSTDVKNVPLSEIQMVSSLQSCTLFTVTPRYLCCLQQSDIQQCCKYFRVMMPPVMSGVWECCYSQCWLEKLPLHQVQKTHLKIFFRELARVSMIWTVVTGVLCPALPRTWWPRCWMSTQAEDWQPDRFWLMPGWHRGTSQQQTFSDRILSIWRYWTLI